MNVLRRLILNGAPDDDRQATAELVSALSLWSCLSMLIGAVVIARACGASLFLSHYGGRELALVYVVVGVAVVGIIYGLSWLTHGMCYERVAIGTVLALGLGTLGFRLWIPQAPGADQHWVFGALYIFLETIALVTTLQVWTLANSLFNSAQAKRLYVFIATGGILGSLLGGMAIRFLVHLPTLDLLWVVVGLCPPMVGAIMVFRGQSGYLRQVVVRDAVALAKLSRDVSDRETVPWIRHPILRRRGLLRLAGRLSLLTFLAAFTTNVIDFYFKTYADEQFHGDTASLTRFFGSFYLSVGSVSLIVQLVLTPLIVRRASVFVGLALTPLVLSLGAALNLLGASLLRATILKLLDSSFAHSVQRSCTEMLYIPLPSNVTGEIKLISEGVASRAGLVVSGLVLWILAPSLDPNSTLGLVIGLLGCWFAALMILRRTYAASAASHRGTGEERSRRTARAA